MGLLLEVRDLHLYYRTIKGVVQAVDGVDLRLEEGKVVGLVGESGCGKSSTANAIMKLLPKNTARYDGEILFDGVNIIDLDDEIFRREYRWKRIAMVFQGAMNSLNPVIKVGDQVAEPLILKEGYTRAEAEERVKELFRMLNLPESFVNRYPHELSGGMKQRVVIAMAMVLEPQLLILDEPTSALDVSVQAQIMNLLKKLKELKRMSMIFITHDIALASDLSDYMAIMYAGKIVEFGTIEEVLLDPKHPYSQGLIAATPVLSRDVPPKFLPGNPPSLINPPKGCRFKDRCKYRMDVCDNEPNSIKLSDSRYVKCFLYH